MMETINLLGHRKAIKTGIITREDPIAVGCFTQLFFRVLIFFKQFSLTFLFLQ